MNLQQEIQLIVDLIPKQETKQYAVMFKSQRNIKTKDVYIIHNYIQNQQQINQELVSKVISQQNEQSDSLLNKQLKVLLNVQSDDQVLSKIQDIMLENQNTPSTQIGDHYSTNIVQLQTELKSISLLCQDVKQQFFNCHLEFNQNVDVLIQAIRESAHSLNNNVDSAINDQQQQLFYNQLQQMQNEQENKYNQLSHQNQTNITNLQEQIQQFNDYLIKQYEELKITFQSETDQNQKNVQLIDKFKQKDQKIYQLQSEKAELYQQVYQLERATQKLQNNKINNMQFKQNAKSPVLLSTDSQLMNISQTSPQLDGTQSIQEYRHQIKLQKQKIEALEQKSQDYADQIEELKLIYEDYNAMCGIDEQYNNLAHNDTQLRLINQKLYMKNQELRKNLRELQIQYDQIQESYSILYKQRYSKMQSPYKKTQINDIESTIQQDQSQIQEFDQFNKKQQPSKKIVNINVANQELTNQNDISKLKLKLVQLNDQIKSQNKETEKYQEIHKQLQSENEKLLHQIEKQNNFKTKTNQMQSEYALLKQQSEEKIVAQNTIISEQEIKIKIKEKTITEQQNIIQQQSTIEQFTPQDQEKISKIKQLLVNLKQYQQMNSVIILSNGINQITNKQLLQSQKYTQQLENQKQILTNTTNYYEQQNCEIKLELQSKQEEVLLYMQQLQQLQQNSAQDQQQQQLQNDLQSKNDIIQLKEDLILQKSRNNEELKKSVSNLQQQIMQLQDLNNNQHNDLLNSKLYIEERENLIQTMEQQQSFQKQEQSVVKQQLQQEQQKLASAQLQIIQQQQKIQQSQQLATSKLLQSKRAESLSTDNDDSLKLSAFSSEKITNQNINQQIKSNSEEYKQSQQSNMVQQKIDTSKSLYQFQLKNYLILNKQRYTIFLFLTAVVLFVTILIIGACIPTFKLQQLKKLNNLKSNQQNIQLAQCINQLNTVKIQFAEQQKIYQQSQDICSLNNNEASQCQKAADKLQEQLIGCQLDFNLCDSQIFVNRKLAAFLVTVGIIAYVIKLRKK